jgi:hypothetical protein
VRRTKSEGPCGYDCSPCAAQAHRAGTQRHRFQSVGLSPPQGRRRLWLRTSALANELQPAPDGTGKSCHFSADAQPQKALEPETSWSVDPNAARFTFGFTTHGDAPTAGPDGVTVLASIHAIKSRRRYRTARPAWTYAGPNALVRQACKVLTESLSRSAACTSVIRASKSLVRAVTLMDIIPHRLRYGATVTKCVS